MENRIARAVERVLTSRPVAWRDRCERGCTPNLRWSVDLEDGSSVFVKAAVNTDTAAWLRAEYRVYSQVQASFLPRLLGWHDAGDEFPILILENLEGAYWPPPWTKESIAVVCTALEQIAALQPLPNLPTLSESLKDLPGWFSVAQNPQPFLSLQLCSATWLERALPTLTAAEREVVLDGNSLVHCDLRSDNLCLRGESAVLIDWNHACIGNAQLDLMSWLPSLHADGGPEPEEVVGHGRGASEFAAYFSGYWAACAGMPPIANAPRVRPLQLQQLKVALPWAVRALKLPPLNGCKL
jgi:hypothetical protein